MNLVLQGLKSQTLISQGFTVTPFTGRGVVVQGYGSPFVVTQGYGVPATSKVKITNRAEYAPPNRTAKYVIRRLATG